MAGKNPGSGVEGLLVLLTEQDAEESRISEERKKAQEERQALHRELKERVLAGESTGDPVADYVISVHGYPSDELTAAYRDLKTRVDACAGQPILAVEAREERNVRYCFGEPSDGGDRSTHLEQTYHIGVLSGPLELTLGEDDWVLPTEGHIRWHDRGSDRIFRQEGGIRTLMMRYFMVETEKTVTATDSFHDGVPALRLVVGWEELDAFGDSAETGFEASGISLRDRGSERYGNLKLRRSEHLLMLFSELEVDVPEAMPKLLAYRDRNVAETVEYAKTALDERDALIEKFGKALLKGRALDEARERVKKLNGILTGCHHVLTTRRASGDVAERVAKAVASFQKEKTA